jgi:hypothetical protein
VKHLGQHAVDGGRVLLFSNGGSGGIHGKLLAQPKPGWAEDFDGLSRSELINLCSNSIRMNTRIDILFGGASALAVSLLLCAGCASQPASTGSTTPAVAPAAATPTAAAASKVALKLVKVDSEETSGEDGKGANAVDGNRDTFWHTQWQDANPPCPHEIVIELASSSTLKGFTYLPRQDEGINGTIKGYEFYVSNDGQDFGQPVAKGEFAEGKELKTVTFEPKTCRFIKLKALSEINGEAWTSAAEIGIVQ